MADESDKFFDIFKTKTLTKSEKFNFKKVEKNGTKSNLPETVSRFFKTQEKPVKSKDVSVEDKLEALFSDDLVIKESPVKNQSQDIKTGNSGKNVDKSSSNLTQRSFKFKAIQRSNSSDDFEPTQKISPEKLNKTLTPDKPKLKNILSKSKDEHNRSGTQKSSQENKVSKSSSSKFQFKKKVVNNVSEAFESLFGEKMTQRKIDISENIKCKPETVTSKVQISNHVKSSINKANNSNITDNVNQSDSFVDSPVVSRKKFTFKTPIISESSSTSSPSILPSKSSDKLNISKRDSIISISSTESSPVVWQKKPEKDQSLLNDEITFVSQSLAANQNDYMDDETFEKLLRDKKLDDLDNVNWEDDFFEDEASTSKNTQNNLVAEVSAIDWNEDFNDENESTPFIPEISFKDRVEHLSEFTDRYHFSSTMEEILHQKFGLQTFRPQQREIINAALNRHDCFVLMPTGGGKSLCYQLPAVLSEGVSIVISPLRALIGDQVDKMNELEIPAAHMCQDVSKEETGAILAKLHVREPLIKLLYLTPEKIVASRAVEDVLKSLYQRGKLARFIIDEAHCLSHWGHDFRPDYKQMSFLKSEFKDVPIMCLTATATKQVENDVISILKLSNVKRFIMSFNRPNIKYQVIPKKGKFANDEIKELIKKKFQKKSGIIYCLTRNDCENLADTLNNAGIKTRPYHAGLSDKIRNAIQREWMQDRFFVIVATIAFGMGIDKPDVRFVIHNSIPKSVEAFYQESGRAGRDGDISYSYLFYNYYDVQRLQKIMRLERKTTSKVLEGHMASLKQMVSFAENKVDCRRYLQLIHLGENFDRQLCIRNKPTTCDNCENINSYDDMEVTKEAKDLGCLVKDLCVRGNFTMLHVADVYKGSKVKKILQCGHDKHKLYGAGSGMDKTDIHRILKDMVLKNILRDHVTYAGEFPVVYIQPGEKFDALNQRNLKISITITKKQLRPIPTVTEESYDSPDETEEPGPSKLPPLAAATVSKPNKATYTAFNKTKINNLKVECHEALLEECRKMALERNLTLSAIMNLTAIKTMSDVLPKTKEEFLKIPHVTVANYKKCGENFLAITKKFREQVDALEVAPKIVDKSKFFGSSYDDSGDWSSMSQSSGGIKRKSTWGGAKKGGYKKRKTYRKKKTATAKKGGWVKKGGGGKRGGGGGGLGLMPIHVK